MTREPEAVLDGLLALLPPGWALPRDRASALAAVLSAPAGEIAAAEAQAAQLLAEIDPRTADALLTGYERVLGPDPCNPDGPADRLGRRREAHHRWTLLGGQSRAFFVALAAREGIAITIEERRPFKAGVSKAGQRAALRDCRFTWRVRLPSTRVVAFRAGAGRAGQSLGRIEPVGVECPIRRLAPAHTTPVFSYGA